MTQRTDQVASEIQRAVSQELARGLNDARIRGLVSVTRVTVSQDMADATVGISVLPAEHAELTLHGLRSATPHLQRAVARAVQMRRVPRLAFQLDRSLKRLAEIDGALAAARNPGNDSTAPPPVDSPQPPTLEPEDPTT